MNKYDPNDYLHRFGYGDKEFVLEPLTADAIDDANEVMSAERADLLPKLLAFYEGRVDKRTFAALRKVPVKVLFQEFRVWAGIEQQGVTPGESDGSPRE